MSQSQRVLRLAAAWVLAALCLLAVPRNAATASVDSTQVGPRPESAVLIVANRPVFEFRSEFMGYTPASRLVEAQRRLRDVIKAHRGGAVTLEKVDEGTLVNVDGRFVFAVAAGDVDPRTNGTLDALAEQTQRDLADALAAAWQQRSLTVLIRGILFSILATVLLIYAIKYLRRLTKWSSAKLEAYAQRRMERLKVPAASVSTQLVLLLRFLVRSVAAALALLLSYSWLAFVLNEFPYTSPWGNQLGGYLGRTLGTVVVAILRSIPGILMMVIIFAMARVVSRWTRLFFVAARQGRIQVPGIDAETAMPTLRLVVIFVWVLAIALAFPFIPGSSGPAFKGISVLLGLMVSLGASNVVGQAASGYILLYSRSLRNGDYVRIGEHEGIIVSMNTLSTKIRTPLDEEINVPNSVIVNSTTKNYTRLTRDAGSVLATPITIGYGVPWRQVHALLIEAAGRTDGVRRDAEPRVLQKSLGDFYVEYALIIRLERADQRTQVASSLHANIQDCFNEHGVQIMSPHYENDPAERVWVPRDKWYEPPAAKSDAPTD